MRKAHKNQSVVGIKDSRMVLTFSYWAKHVESMKILEIYRRPLEVARSFGFRKKEYSYADCQQALNSVEGFQ
jgi:hypothetical protein